MNKAYLVSEILLDDEWSGIPTGYPTKPTAVFMNLKTAKEYISKHTNIYLEYEEIEIIKD